MELSQREYAVADLLSQGRTEKEIASMLFISPKTVNNHKSNIRNKWGARNTADIVRKYILQLEDPKRYFTSIGLLAIQIMIILNAGVFDMRRPNNNRSKTPIKISRKIDA